MNHPRHQLTASKQARSAATRTRLLEAALDCLAELGYAGASTARIAKRAGVSQGALYKHFPTKALLWALAAAHLFGQLRRRFLTDLMTRVQAEAPDSDPLDIGLDVLWDIFCAPRLLGVFELYLVARTDDEIADVLTPVLAEHQAGITQLVVQLFPDKLDQRATLEPLLWAMLNTLQGAALMRRVNPVQSDRPLEFEFIKTIARQTLGAITLPKGLV